MNKKKSDPRPQRRRRMHAKLKCTLNPGCNGSFVGLFSYLFLTDARARTHTKCYLWQEKRNERGRKENRGEDEKRDVIIDLVKVRQCLDSGKKRQGLLVLPLYSSSYA